MFGRLRKSAEFEGVRTMGKRRRGTYCTINFAPTNPPGPTMAINTNGTLTRVGYITSKKVGNAVQRNRARRLMREAMRHLSTHIAAGWDIVLIAHSSLVEPSLKMPVLRKELEWLLKQASIMSVTPNPTLNTGNLLSKSLPGEVLPDES